MEQTATVFDTWYNATTKLVNDWREMTEKITSEQKNSWEDVGKMQQSWMHSFQSMMQNMQAPFMPGGGAGNLFAHSGMRDAFTNMLKSSDVYTRLMQLWQPVLSAMQNNSFQPQEFWKHIDQQGFKTFVDKLFGFDAVSPARNFMEQSLKGMRMWGETFAEASKSFGPMMGNGLPFFNAMSQMNPQSLTAWYGEMMKTAQRSFAPFVGSTSTGTMPSPQSVMELMQQWGNYMEKQNQLQGLVYQRSVSAWEKVMQAMTERSQAGTPPTDFNQFYNEWSAINEQEFTALFNTEEYAALQGELIKLNSELNKAYERQMEVLLQPYPVVLRSQLDEVYKVNHELRSRLNDLERLVNELQNARSESNGQAAAQAPAAPASDASQGGQPNQSNDPGKAVRKDKS